MPRVREADYAIQGFLYQFNKTLLEVLRASPDDRIICEGPIEDTDIHRPDGSVLAIQSKYHETQLTFVPSAIFKPLLEMMYHYVKNVDIKVKYTLYAYFPNEPPSSRQPTIDELCAALSTNSAKLRGMAETINILEPKLEDFQKVCTIEFGPSYDDLKSQIIQEFKNSNISQDSIETLFYPNAIHEIADLSRRHQAKDRTIMKQGFIKKLESIRKTAISKWTLALRSRKQILRARKSQLRNNLSKNSRRRCFILSQKTFGDFSSGVVLFIKEFVEKYHFKPLHDQPPVFYLDCDSKEFDLIRTRLFECNIKFTDGMIGNSFRNDHFFRKPMVVRVTRTIAEREFHIRITTYELTQETLAKHPFDDIFIVGEKVSELVEKDMEIEYLSVNSFSDLKFILGITNVIE